MENTNISPRKFDWADTGLDSEVPHANALSFLKKKKIYFIEV